jgi:hypothetical protein
MSYQRGSLKKVKRKEGETWVLRYRVTLADGRRAEHNTPVGLVAVLPKESDAWREVDRLGLSVRINDSRGPGRVSFHSLAQHYLKADFGVDAVHPKSVGTTSHVEHVVRAYLVPRFGDEIAEEIKPLDIQRWLKSLHVDKSLAWPTIAKIRGAMRRIYKIGIVHGHVAKNPLMHTETRSKSDYKAIVITPPQMLGILHSLPSPLHFTLVLTCSATALRASEMLSLRWAECCGRKRGYGSRSAGQRVRTARQKLEHRMATFHGMPSSRISCGSGGCRRRMPPMAILSFHL